jgi:hypothetical protein
MPKAIRFNQLGGEGYHGSHDFGDEANPSADPSAAFAHRS